MCVGSYGVCKGCSIKENCLRIFNSPPPLQPPTSPTPPTPPQPLLNRIYICLGQPLLCTLNAQRKNKRSYLGLSMQHNLGQDLLRRVSAREIKVLDRHSASTYA